MASVTQRGNELARNQGNGGAPSQFALMQNRRLGEIPPLMQIPERARRIERFVLDETARNPHITTDELLSSAGKKARQTKAAIDLLKMRGDVDAIRAHGETVTEMLVITPVGRERLRQIWREGP